MDCFLFPLATTADLTAFPKANVVFEREIVKDNMQQHNGICQTQTQQIRVRQQNLDVIQILESAACKCSLQ